MVNNLSFRVRLSGFESRLYLTPFHPCALEQIISLGYSFLTTKIERKASVSGL